MKKQQRSQELLQTIIIKAWEDKAFKQELITNSKEAIETLTGEKLNIPENRTLIVVDQTDASNVYINIPPKLNLEDLELNEEQLEAVAGGKDDNNGYSWYAYVLSELGLWSPNE
ncbi:NHLP leader peptide family RiPP precursor [Tenacibaculum ovolyticum]|uniref:NHLP leader peptide family RiPP precursor n=1 Tax=Tenacibaculum ovolyticum TaxID=104270 RepID=UPI0022F3BAC5|nr:NHLP leader peptide family RiPP precursor [Tenacibaculum ovolyticum]WBX76788.1 NHLP leader peptide family RiPP precursor [Tenacibaculum ovolyticum]